MRTLHIAHYKTIAFVIHSVDRSLSTRLIAHYKTIAFVIRSVDPTRNQPQRLVISIAVRTLHIAHYKTIALVIHSVDRTLQDYRLRYSLS